MIFVVNLENAGNVLNSSMVFFPCQTHFDFFSALSLLLILSYCYKKVLLNVGCLSYPVFWDNATFEHGLLCIHVKPSLSATPNCSTSLV